ncbi:MAG: pilus assembly protein TadG-related protein [Acidimicrobiia bacterium]
MRRIGRGPNQRGAVLAWTAILLTVLIGCAALAIDLGLGWMSRRNLVTTTDAAALAAAAEYSAGGDGCASVASSYVGLNAPGATMTACDVSANGTTGYVTVDALENINTNFAQVLGVTDFDTTSSSTAQWGPPSAATGLRPYGLCSESAEMQAFLANPQATQTHTIAYTKTDLTACGNSEGNWGEIALNRGSPSQSQIKDWVENGYNGEVLAGTLGGICAVEAYACYPPSPGTITGASKEMKDLQDSGIYFGLPIFDSVEGNGANAQFHLVGFVKVRVVDFKFNGAEQNRYMTLEFSPGLITGSCCNPGGPQTNAVVIAICAVDRNNLGAC